jgi:hypothetical protein
MQRVAGFGCSERFERIEDFGYDKNARNVHLNDHGEIGRGRPYGDSQHNSEVRSGAARRHVARYAFPSRNDRGVSLQESSADEMGPGHTISPTRERGTPRPFLRHPGPQRSHQPPSVVPIQVAARSGLRSAICRTRFSGARKSPARSRASRRASTSRRRSGLPRHALSSSAPRFPRERRRGRRKALRHDATHSRPWMKERIVPRAPSAVRARKVCRMAHFAGSCLPQYQRRAASFQNCVMGSSRFTALRTCAVIEIRWPKGASLEEASARTPYHGLLKPCAYVEIHIRELERPTSAGTAIPVPSIWLLICSATSAEPTQNSALSRRLESGNGVRTPNRTLFVCPRTDLGCCGGNGAKQYASRCWLMECRDGFS